MQIYTYGECKMNHSYLISPTHISACSKKHAQRLYVTIASSIQDRRPPILQISEHITRTSWMGSQCHLHRQLCWHRPQRPAAAAPLQCDRYWQPTSVTCTRPARQHHYYNNVGQPVNFLNTGYTIGSLTILGLLTVESNLVILMWLFLTDHMNGVSPHCVEF